MRTYILACALLAVAGCSEDPLSKLEGKWIGSSQLNTSTGNYLDCSHWGHLNFTNGIRGFEIENSPSRFSGNVSGRPNQVVNADITSIEVADDGSGYTVKAGRRTIRIWLIDSNTLTIGRVGRTYKRCG